MSFILPWKKLRKKFRVDAKKTHDFGSRNIIPSPPKLSISFNLSNTCCLSLTFSCLTTATWSEQCDPPGPKSDWMYSRRDSKGSVPREGMSKTWTKMSNGKRQKKGRWKIYRIHRSAGKRQNKQNIFTWNVIFFQWGELAVLTIDTVDWNSPRPAKSSPSSVTSFGSSGTGEEWICQCSDNEATSALNTYFLGTTQAGRTGCLNDLSFLSHRNKFYM